MSIFSYLYSEKSGDYCEYNGDLKEYILRVSRGTREVQVIGPAGPGIDKIKDLFEDLNNENV